MIEDLIIESEIIARDEINAGVFLDLPMLQTKTLSLREQVLLRELTTPISLGSFLEVAKTPDTRETENRSGEK